MYLAGALAGPPVRFFFAFADQNAFAYQTNYSQKSKLFLCLVAHSQGTPTRDAKLQANQFCHWIDRPLPPADPVEEASDRGGPSLTAAGCRARRRCRGSLVGGAGVDAVIYFCKSSLQAPRGGKGCLLQLGWGGTGGAASVRRSRPRRTLPTRMTTQPTPRAAEDALADATFRKPAKGTTLLRTPRPAAGTPFVLEQGRPRARPSSRPAGRLRLALKQWDGPPCVLGLPGRLHLAGGPEQDRKWLGHLGSWSRGGRWLGPPRGLPGDSAWRSNSGTALLCVLGLPGRLHLAGGSEQDRKWLR